MNIPADLGQWGKAQRAELLARRLAAEPRERKAWNETITWLLEEGFPILQQMVVGFCWPYKGEFDARFLIHSLRASGVRAALPAVIEKKAPLQFREWWPGVPMTPGVFDLPVPDNTDVVVPDALLIPPVGFGEQGDRLGYGGGFSIAPWLRLLPSRSKSALRSSCRGSPPSTRNRMTFSWTSSSQRRAYTR